MATGHSESPYDNPYDDDHAVLNEDFLNDGATCGRYMELETNFLQKSSLMSPHTTLLTAPH